MSTLGTIQVAYRRFNGYRDPRYPEGQWVGSVTVSGDGSGGTTTGSLVFAEATDVAINSRIYSLEELGLSIDATSDTEGRISTDNLGSGGPAAFQHRFSVELTAVANLTTVQIAAGQLTMLPLFLGAMRVLSVQTRILAGIVNPGVGDDMRFEAAGYWWGSRSVLADGGPQRPPTGLYRA